MLIYIQSFYLGVRNSKVLNRVDDNNFDAKLTVGYKALDENYTSRVKGIYLKKYLAKLLQGLLNI